MPKVKSIKKISDSSYQKCIKVSNPEGLFALDNGLITHNSSDYIMELYNKGKSRVESRMKGNYYGRTILDSSPNNTDNAIDNYIINDADRDPTNYIVKGSMWQWEPDEYDFSKTFKVYTGGKGNPPRIVEEGDPLLKSNTAEYTKIIEIPERFSDGRSVKQYFIDDIVEALKDRAGIPSGSADNLIYDYDKLERIFKPGLRNIYTNIYASSLESPIHLIWDQIKDIFFKYRAGKYEYYYKPWAPRYIGVDQSYSTDVTCISMVHAERYRDSGELIYVVDFTIPIVPLKDGGVNLEAIRCFIEDLKNLGGIRIEGIGFDSFQSEITKQNLSRAGFNVKDVSTDKTMEPYLDVVNLINTGRIACGRNIFFKNNLKSLHTTKTKNGKGNKPKIDHDNSREGITYSEDTSWEHSPLGSYAKDVSDAVADAIYLCKKETIISSDTWWDEPKVGDFEDGSKDKKTAKENLNKLMNKFGLH